MVSPSIGSVVLVKFPFSDLTATKLRPAVVLADADRGDWILCQITSNTYADRGALELTDASFSQGGLHRTSYARPSKLFTAHASLLVREVGLLTGGDFGRVIHAVVQVLTRRTS